MLITLATDMVLKRQIWFVNNVNQLSELLLHALIMQQFDSCERIVNKDGKVVSRWKS